ncbi:hypothetical protein P3T27_008098 [Kitasatospora sp. MAA19]|uniref:hypothetical protein n=1 Tax=unclassified Kitasatospora TaxID=2633591 RepID=UPI00247538C5|nr:hypothetical protein [Kitasatospora sp. MAA19]MDH6711340.1 hypothetical protein [Kitasatospora sp. MAA19]
MTTTVTVPPPTVFFLAENLSPTPRNLHSAVEALARITAQAWAPLSGYPGSDTHWRVRCLLCGWEGTRFYSHLRRARPVGRHKGCLPQEQRQAKLAQLAAQAPAECHCWVAHPVTAADAADVLAAIEQARRIDDSHGLTTHLRRLLGPCPAAAARALAVKQATARS